MWSKVPNFGQEEYYQQLSCLLHLWCYYCWGSKQNNEWDNKGAVHFKKRERKESVCCYWWGFYRNLHLCETVNETIVAVEHIVSRPFMLSLGQCLEAPQAAPSSRLWRISWVLSIWEVFFPFLFLWVHIQYLWMMFSTLVCQIFYLFEERKEVQQFRIQTSRISNSWETSIAKIHLVLMSICNNNNRHPMVFST